MNLVIRITLQGSSFPMHPHIFVSKWSLKFQVRKRLNDKRFITGKTNLSMTVVPVHRQSFGVAYSSFFHVDDVI